MSSASSTGGCKMRNRILHLTRNTIPYVKDLRPLAGSIAGCILMQQLDYWFERHPDGFWKFLSPSDHPNYRQGDSWVEELAISEDEFRTAFDKIGIRYKSKTLFDKEQDQFQDKFYCSYLDRRVNLTFYFRNHAVVDTALENLIFKNHALDTVNQEPQFTANGHGQSSGNGDIPPLQMGNHHLQEMGNLKVIYTENTFTETTHTQQQPSANQQSSITEYLDLVYPKIANPEVTAAIQNLMQHVQDRPLERQQELLDELENAIRTNAIRKGVVQYFRGLIDRELNNKFSPCGGFAIQASRKAAIRNELAVSKAYAQKVETNPESSALGLKIMRDARMRNKAREKEEHVAN